MNEQIDCRLKSQDFCVLKQAGTTISKCKSYQCSPSLCSNTKQSCDDLNIWSNTFNKYMFHLFKIYSIERIPTLVFSIFQSTIQDCKPITDLIALNSEICLSNMNKCRENINWSSRLNIYKNPFLIRNFPYCNQCSGQFKYDCGNMICSSSEETCGYINSFNNNLNTENINKC